MVDTRHPISTLRTTEFQDGQAAGSITPQRMRDLLISLDTGLLLAGNYGVKSDGSTNDTTAWNTVLTAAATASADGKPVAVLAPPGVSAISSISIPAGVTLFGHPCHSYPFNNGSTRLMNGGSILKQISGTGAVVTMVGSHISNAGGETEDLGIGLSDIGILGIGNIGITQQVPSGPAYITRVRVTACSWGWDTDAVPGYGWAIFDNCTFSGNNSGGIRKVVDGRISNCFIAANDGDGIDLTGGSSSTSIVNNRIEFNTGHGIISDATDLIIVAGNSFDAMSKTSIHFTNAQGSIIGNVMRRSGYNTTAGSVDDAHIFLSGNTMLVVSGNTTEVDSNGTTNVPHYTLAGGANTGCVVTGNCLRGYVTALNNPTPPTGLTLANNLV